MASLNTLINYKHSLFHASPVDTTGVEIVKSKLFGWTWYAVRGGEVLCVLDKTVARDSAALYYALEGRPPRQVEKDMWADELEERKELRDRFSK